MSLAQGSAEASGKSSLRSMSVNKSLVKWGQTKSSLNKAISLMAKLRVTSKVLRFELVRDAKSSWMFYFIRKHRSCKSNNLNSSSLWKDSDAIEIENKSSLKCVSFIKFRFRSSLWRAMGNICKYKVEYRNKISKQKVSWNVRLAWRIAQAV